MSHRLIDVMSTEDRGLIGFTDIGEEVPLNAPEPRSLHSFVSDALYEIEHSEQRQNLLIKQAKSDIEDLLKELGDDEYILSGMLDTCNKVLITSYDLYTRRK